MSVDRGMDKKGVCIHTMEYYSAIRKNEIMPFAATWVDLEIITLSELGQTKENIAYMWNRKKKKKGYK